MNTLIIILLLSSVFAAYIRSLIVDTITGTQRSGGDYWIRILVFCSISLISEVWIIDREYSAFVLLLVRICFLLIFSYSKKHRFSLLVMGILFSVLLEFSIHCTAEFLCIVFTGRKMEIFMGISRLYDKTNINLFLHCSILLFDICIYYAIKKYLVTLREINENNGLRISFLLILILFVEAYISELVFEWAFAESRIVISMFFMFFFVDLTLIFMLLISISEYEKKEHEKEALMLTTLNHSMKKGYETIIRINDEQKKAIHDFRNYLLTMQSMEPEKVPSFIADLLEHRVRTTKKTFCKDPYIDAVINSKLHTIEQININLDIQILLIKALNISPSDICSIVSNQLDNAIEACKKIPDQTNRWIRYSINQKGNITVFTCENSILEHSLYPGQKLDTSKKNSKHLHGLGLKNIAQATERNGGSSQYKIEKDTFISIAMVQTI